MSAADTLNIDSLKWAKAHFSRFGDNDLLPKPPEFDAIDHHWTSVSKALSELDLTAVHPGSSEVFMAPKATGGFRPATRLTPTGSLLLAAMVHEVAADIENSRVHQREETVFSYRLKPEADGAFFAQTDGWYHFIRKSLEIARLADIQSVLVADISDFYPSIYLHRVESNLPSSTGCRADSIHRFLLNLHGANQSQGLPVGPAASIALAEISLNDVDRAPSGP